VNPHRDSIEQAERLGFGAIWVRDLPLYDPDFGDAGQVVDPWVCLGATPLGLGKSPWEQRQSFSLCGIPYTRQKQPHPLIGFRKVA
jgi:hypothetical protein